MKRRGYSLIELVIVMSLAGTMLYMTVFAFQSAVPRYRLKICAQAVTAMLNQARFRSAWSGRPCRFRTTGGVVLLETRDKSGLDWVPFRTFVPEGATVAANNQPVFHPQGTVSNLATITVSNPAGAYRITLAISGRVKSVRTT